MQESSFPNKERELEKWKEAINELKNDIRVQDISDTFRPFYLQLTNQDRPADELKLRYLELTDMDFKCFVKKLLSDTICQKISLKHTKLSEKNIILLCILLAQNSTLTELDLRDTKLTPDMVTSLLTTIGQRNFSLTTLLVNDNEKLPKELIERVAVVLKQNRQIFEVSITGHIFSSLTRK